MLCRNVCQVADAMIKVPTRIWKSAATSTLQFERVGLAPLLQGDTGPTISPLWLSSVKANTLFTSVPFTARVQ
jgi:hypothetical protein